MTKQQKPDVSLALKTIVRLATFNPNGLHVDGHTLKLLRDAMVVQRSAITTALESLKQHGDLVAINEVQRFL